MVSLVVAGKGRTAGPAGLMARVVEAVRTAAELDGAGVVADERQREVLAAFPGWGPVAKLFDAEPQGMWAGAADQLDELGGDVLARASRVVDTSFFTPEPLVRHIWGVLQAAGFTGGSVLDLGCGTGNFVRFAPAGLDLAVTGVEADPLSANIARVLCPGAEIVTGELQKVSLPHRRFDAAIGNVPFSAARVHDSATGFYGPLHQYFVQRAVAAVRPGGYVVLVTSRHSMDAAGGLGSVTGRDADLLAAVRLPSGYFKASGTDVVADVLVLRVREGSEDGRGWRPQKGSKPHTLAGMVGGRYCRESVSAFWDEHPQLVTGTMRLTGFDRQPLAVDTDNPAAAVKAAFAAVEPLLVPYVGGGAATGQWEQVRLADDEGRKEGSLHVVDGQVVTVVDGELVAVPRPSAELRMLIGLRDAAVALMDAESDWDTADAVIEPLRVACREAYMVYQKRFGAINRGVVTEGKPDLDTGMPRLGWRAATLGGFRADPDAAIVAALELFDQETGQAVPAPILTRRVNKRPVPKTRADTAGEALSISLGEGRGVDLVRIAGLLGIADPEQAVAELGNLVYCDPRDGSVVTARDYLAGDVRAKLRDALAAAAVDRSYERNVTALQAVQPQWLGREEIRIELGSPWVSETDVADFCAEVFGARPSIDHVAPLAAWDVEGRRAAMSAEAQIAYCTARMDGFELLQIGLNGAAPIVFDEVYDSVQRTSRKVRNPEATEAAEQKLAAIQERFSLWVWEDVAREQRISDQYNNVMNAHVLRQHDGAHLTFPGLADGTELWPWQRDFVDRAVSTPAVFCGHEVSMGKSLSAVAVAMTLRQFGLANKIGLVVPCHLIEQWTRQAYQYWPSGRFLIVNRADLHGEARRRFVARCSTGDWDLVIMTHETFSSLPVPADVERAWLDDQLGELQNYARTQGATGKRIAAAVRTLEGRIDKLRSSFNDPKAITFKNLGLDYLVVDEADAFRRLPVTTRAAGFSLGSSKRATDLFLKISMLRRANPDRPHACLLTGTPFTNTLAEGFIWQRMLAPEQLQRTGLTHFDAWAAQFVRYEVMIETSPDGAGFRSRRRPAVIHNVPELRTQISQFMSMVRAETAGLPRPTAVRHTEVSAPTDAQRDYMTSLVTRADDLRTRRVSSETDNMLLICGDGRKVALDPNLVGICEPAPKLRAVAARVAQIYHHTAANTYSGSTTPGAFQLVLCDLGTPKKGDTQSYGRIRAELIAQGVPAEKVRFVHEATTPKAREALFAGCRDGRVAVLIGSTSKVGIGTNIQHRLHSLHHVDPTWTAAAWEQRNGRGIRNGNQHAEVGVYSYVSSGTFDAYMFGTIERKARGFEQLYRVDGQAREIEDLSGDGTLNFGELKAAAAGNDLLLRQHQLGTRVRKLRLAHLTVQQNVRSMLHQAAQADSTATAATDRLHRLDSLAEHHRGTGAGAGAAVDLSNVAMQACAAREPNHYYSPYQSKWTDGRMNIRITDTNPGQQLELSFDYRPVWSEPLPGKIRRRGHKAVKTWAQERVAAWLGALPAEIDRTRDRITDQQHRATEARAAAAGADTSEPPELIAARTELDAINTAIADELAAQDRPQAA